MTKLKLAIIGTRGIPNYYGGFEQFAEFVSVGLVKAGHEVYVYSSKNHPYQEGSWNGVNIIHCKDPEDKMGTVGQFFYDLNCILDSKKRNFDVILQLGYTSNSVWGWLLPQKSTVVTNMDGLEWKRSKYSKPVRSFLKIAEKLAIKSSDYFIADSIGIQSYLKKKYSVKSEYIPYGAETFNDPDFDLIANKYPDLKPYNYDLLIARMEPENNIEVILKGRTKANCQRPLLLVGGNENKFGSYLKATFSGDKILFLGGIYDLVFLNNLRFYSNIYFHGHSVGGTNPSLLEAMASRTLICAHDNIFNRSILGDDALYFSDENAISKIIVKISKEEYKEMVSNNFNKIQTKYQWGRIVRQYEDFLQKSWALNQS